MQTNSTYCDATAGARKHSPYKKYINIVSSIHCQFKRRRHEYNTVYKYYFFCCYSLLFITSLDLTLYDIVRLPCIAYTILYHCIDIYTFKAQNRHNNKLSTLIDVLDNGNRLYVDRILKVYNQKRFF